MEAGAQERIFPTTEHGVSSAFASAGLESSIKAPNSTSTKKSTVMVYRRFTQHFHVHPWEVIEEEIRPVFLSTRLLRDLTKFIETDITALELKQLLFRTVVKRKDKERDTVSKQLQPRDIKMALSSIRKKQNPPNNRDCLDSPVSNTDVQSTISDNATREIVVCHEENDTTFADHRSSFTYQLNQLSKEILEEVNRRIEGIKSKGGPLFTGSDALRVRQSITQDEKKLEKVRAIHEGFLMRHQSAQDDPDTPLDILEILRDPCERTADKISELEKSIERASDELKTMLELFEKQKERREEIELIQHQVDDYQETSDYFFHTLETLFDLLETQELFGV